MTSDLAGTWWGDSIDDPEPVPTIAYRKVSPDGYIQEVVLWEDASLDPAAPAWVGPHLLALAPGVLLFTGMAKTTSEGPYVPALWLVKGDTVEMLWSDESFSFAYEIGNTTNIAYDPAAGVLAFAVGGFLYYLQLS